MAEPSDHHQLLNLTGEIVAAYAGNQTMPASDLPSLIAGVFAALSAAGKPNHAGKPAEVLTPAVPIRKSVQPEFLVCLEDGRKVKMLKRYLQTRYGMTPADYRRRWSLGDDYPMVAPAYAAQRSTLAKRLGLGRKPAVSAPEPVPEPPATAKPPRRRAPGRRQPA